MWFNTHSHSHYCDGKASPEEYVSVGRAMGMGIIGFSGHAPLPFETLWSMKVSRYPEYLRHISQLADQNPDMKILCGLEVDYIPGRIGPLDFAPDLDYTIGSIHFVDAFEDGVPWEIDGLHSQFNTGLEQIFQGNIRSAIGRYFELTRRMLSESPPTVVGHLDKIKIQNEITPRYEETEEWYQREIRNTLECIREADAIVEVNTRGIYQKKCKEPYPGYMWIREALDMGIRLTLNSDAHHPEDQINQFKETTQFLLSCGCTQLWVPGEQGWEPKTLHHDGIHQ